MLTKGRPPNTIHLTSRTAITCVGVCGPALVLGAGVAHDPLLAYLVVAVFLGALGLALAGVDRFTTLVLAALPWLIVLMGVTPRLTLTLGTTFAVLLLIASRPPYSDVSSVSWIGVMLFLLPLLGHVIESASPEQVIVAAKLSLFPAVVLIASSRAARARLLSTRPLLLASAVGAMATQAAVSILHIGPSGNYYSAGTYSKAGVALGLTPDAPHEMALLGVIVSVACLLTIRDIRWRVTAAAVAATPALATGVRSAVVALMLALVLLILKARLRASMLLTIAAIATVVVFSGVASIVFARFQQGQAAGEYSSIEAAGSGRGAVEATALRQWLASGLSGVTVGTGLGSVAESEQRRYGVSVGAQNDPLAVLVELGVMGVIGWLLLWLALVRAKVNWLVLVPIASYSLTNGDMQYVGALVFGIVIAVACSSPRDTTAVSRVAYRPSVRSARVTAGMRA